jgi:WD40 repeat protein
MQATFSPDGKLLVTAGSEGETVIRDGSTLAVRRVLPISGQVVSSAVFLSSPQGHSLITAAERVVSKWDIETGKQKVLLTLPSPVQMAVLSPSGDHLLVVGTDNSLLLWDMAAEMPLMRWPALPFELSDANFAAPDGRYFLLSTADGKTLVYPDEYRSNLSGTSDRCLQPAALPAGLSICRQLLSVKRATDEGLPGACRGLRTSRPSSWIGIRPALPTRRGCGSRGTARGESGR